MKKQLLSILILIVISWLLASCSAPPQGLSTSLSTPAVDPNLKSNGGGEPRSANYWLIWNTCAEGNQSEVARANGGRESGWFVMDDLLVDPGVLIGAIAVETCTQGVNLLQARDLQGVSHQNDAAYALAAQLLAAQLNLAVSSEYCPALDQAVSQAQLLLLQLNFDGTTDYLGPPQANANVENANKLMEQLAGYNNGSLCIP